MIRTLTIAAALYASTLAAAEAADLTVAVTGVRNANGSVAAALFNSEASFPKAGQAVAAFRVKAAQGSFQVTFHDLPPGRYALTAYHDENDNGKLDTDVTGVPSEGYGVSNNARDELGPPQFAKAAFDLGEAGKTVNVTIKY